MQPPDSSPSDTFPSANAEDPPLPTRGSMGIDPSSVDDPAGMDSPPADPSAGVNSRPTGVATTPGPSSLHSGSEVQPEGAVSGQAGRDRRWSVVQTLLVALVAIGAGTTLFVAGFTLGRQTALTPSTPAQLQAEFQPFWDAYHTIENRFALGPIPPTTLVEGALKGMFQSLGDKYSYYMTAAEYKQSLQGLSGQFVGIGVTVETRAPDGTTGCTPIGPACDLTVIDVIPTAPADRAGVQVGDVILEVDGASLGGKTLDDAVSLIRGPQGSPVTLQLKRGSAAPFTKTIVRAVVTTPDVSTKVLANGTVGYIRIDAFGSNVATAFKRDLSNLVEQRKLTRIVLDLRNDPGGFVDQARAIASQFIGSGPVFYEQSASGSLTEQTAEPGGVATSTSIKLVVLVNGDTASASEIVSGALQATGRGTLVGQQTFGKGTIQEWQLLSNDAGGFRLTIFKWLTPDKRWINQVGLTPNVVVKVPSSTPPGQDPVLGRAIELLTGTSNG